MPLNFAPDRERERGKNRASAFAILADDKGHANWDLCEKLGKDGGYISRLLQDMQAEGLIYKGPSRPTTNPKSTKKRQEEDPFYIKVSDYVYPSFVDYLVKGDLKEDFETFLKSDHMNKIIGEKGFFFAYDLIKQHLSDPERKIIISKALLEQPTTIQKYINYPEVLKNTNELALDLAETPNMGGRDLIKILSFFDPLTAVQFYRKIIKDTYSRLYRERSTNSYFASEAMKEFVDLDVFLSPFTSYPVASTANILFQRPFERIYNDAYILDELDRKKFIMRAYTVYSNFAEILSNGINILAIDEIDLLDYNLVEMDRENDMFEDEFRRDHSDRRLYIKERMEYLHNLKHYVETFVKLSIYYWNIAAYRLNEVDRYLINKGKYHIYSDNEGIQIVDLQTGKRRLDSNKSREIMGHISLLSGPEDPFGSLRPCDGFYELDSEFKKVTYDNMIKEVKTKLIP